MHEPTAMLAEALHEQLAAGDVVPQPPGQPHGETFLPEVCESSAAQTQERSSLQEQNVLAETVLNEHSSGMDMAPLGYTQALPRGCTVRSRIPLPAPVTITSDIAPGGLLSPVADSARQGEAQWSQNRSTPTPGLTLTDSPIPEALRIKIRKEGYVAGYADGIRDSQTDPYLFARGMEAAFKHRHGELAIADSELATVKAALRASLEDQDAQRLLLQKARDALLLRRSLPQPEHDRYPSFDHAVGSIQDSPSSPSSPSPSVMSGSFLADSKSNASIHSIATYSPVSQYSSPSRRLEDRGNPTLPTTPTRRRRDSLSPDARPWEGSSKRGAADGQAMEEREAEQLYEQELLGEMEFWQDRIQATDLTSEELSWKIRHEDTEASQFGLLYQLDCVPKSWSVYRSKRPRQLLATAPTVECPQIVLPLPYRRGNPYQRPTDEGKDSLWKNLHDCRLFGRASAQGPALTSEDVLWRELACEAYFIPFPFRSSVQQMIVRQAHKTVPPALPPPGFPPEKDIIQQLMRNPSTVPKAVRRCRFRAFSQPAELEQYVDWSLSDIGAWHMMKALEPEDKKLRAAWRSAFYDAILDDSIVEQVQGALPPGVVAKYPEAERIGHPRPYDGPVANHLQVMAHISSCCRKTPGWLAYNGLLVDFALRAQWQMQALDVYKEKHNIRPGINFSFPTELFCLPLEGEAVLTLRVFRSQIPGPKQVFPSSTPRTLDHGGRQSHIRSYNDRRSSASPYSTQRPSRRHSSKSPTPSRRKPARQDF